MNKSLLATLALGACVLSVPAFAQVHLGGSASAGAGVHAPTQGALQTAGRAGSRVGDTLQSTGRRTHDAARQTLDDTRHVAHDVHANAGVHANTGIHGQAATHDRSGGVENQTDAHAHAGVGVDTGDVLHRAGSLGRTAGNAAAGTVRSAAHTAGQTAGEVGHSARRATRDSAAVDAHGDASIHTH